MIQLSNESLSNIILDLKEVQARMEMQSYRAAGLLLEMVICMLESRRGEDQ